MSILTLSNLPAINAALNLCSTVFLLLGMWAIKNNKKSFHIKCMVYAFATSSLFLACYLYYHFNVEFITQFHGTGVLKWIYFGILSTHIPLATGMLPFIFFAFYLGFTKQYTKHKRVVKILWPVWFYVSITGVIIYILLYHFNFKINSGLLPNFQSIDNFY